MRKITFCLGLLLYSVFSLGANAAAGDPVMLESGKYTIRNSANSGYCFSNGAQIIRNAPQTLLDAYAFTVTYVESKEAYTIQDFNGKYLTNSNNNIVVQETCDEDNSYWRIVENYGPGTGYDIISLTLDNAAGSKSWNFAGNYNKKGANSLLGTWEADNKDSVWAFTKYEKDNSHLDKSNWTVTASSACIDSGENGPIDNILDEDVTTYWHSNWRTAGTDNAYGIGNTMPQWFIIDLGKEETFSQFSYSRRYNGNNGTCSQYKLYVQSEPFAAEFSQAEGCTADIQTQVSALEGAVSEGSLSFADIFDNEKKIQLSQPVTGRYVMFVLTEATGNFGSCSEFDLFYVSPEEVLSPAKQRLTDLLEAVGGKYPFDIEEGMTQTLWPGEYEFSVPNADLFTNANTALAGNDLAAIETAISNLTSYKDLSTSYGYPASVIYEFKAEYGTILLPGNIAVPTGVTAYNCNSTTNGVLNLERLTTGFKANTPYIVQGTVGTRFQLIGYDRTNLSESTLTTGILTGVYENTTAPIGSYVLQNKDGKLGFYKVMEGQQPTVGANRCYVTLPEETSQSGVRALFFSEETTGIGAVGNESPTDAPAVYDLSGRRVEKMQKGIYIIGGKKVLVK